MKFSVSQATHVEVDVSVQELFVSLWKCLQHRAGPEHHGFDMHGPTYTGNIICVT